MSRTDDDSITVIEEVHAISIQTSFVSIYFEDIFYQYERPNNNLLSKPSWNEK